MVSIITPNYNGKKFLKTCLDSLRAQTYKNFEIILVDNGSTDGSVDFVKQNYPEVKIISLPTNKGFAYAVNTGIRRSQGEYIALLNNDTEADPRWLKALQTALEGNPQIDFCASKMLFFDDRTKINSVGIFCLPSGSTGDRGLGETDTGQYDQPEEVFGACSGAAMYRRSVFEDVGLFDEDFFAYAEDPDISFRAQLRGHKCLYVPNAVVFHVISGTADPKSPFLAYYANRNPIYFIAKNMPGPLIGRYFLNILGNQIWVFLKSFGILITRRSPRIFWARVKGKIDGSLGIPKMWKKRHQIQATRTVSIEYIRSLLGK